MQSGDWSSDVCSSDLKWQTRCAEHRLQAPYFDCAVRRSWLLMASPLIPQLGKPSGNERKEWRAVPSDQATPRGCEQWTTCLWTRQFRCPWQVSRDPDQKVNGLMIKTKAFQDFPGGSDSKEYTYSEGDPGSIPGSRRLPWRREWQPAPEIGRAHV